VEAEIDINATVGFYLTQMNCYRVLCCVKDGFGWSLVQKGEVVAYTSRQLKIHERHYPIHDLELATMMFVLKV
jgi:hypothetical protein